MKIDSFFKPLLYLAALGLLGLFAHLVYANKEGQWITFLAASVVLICTRLPDIEKFGLNKDGLTAEMRRAISEAQASVAQLHDLAELFAKISVQQIAGGGRWGGTSEREKRVMIDGIFAGLRKIGVEEAKIADIRSVQEPWDNIDYFSFVVKPVNHNNDPEVQRVWNEFFIPFSNSRDRPTPAQTEEFLNANNLLTDDIRERLTDWRHYQQHKTHRRRDIWEARNDREW